MAQLHGKQIQNDSVSLNKINDSGLVTFTNATMSFESGSSLKVNYVISDGTDVVNKNYVDSIAQGLHVKESVRVIATSSITLLGTQSIDGYLLQEGDRVLVNGQDNSNPTSSNGIYIVNSASWSRSEDADGSTDKEVAVGDFVFVSNGDTYATTGWVLSQTDAADQYDIQVDLETQKWVQFSMAGVIEAGQGLIKTGSTLDVNVGIGLTISTIDNTLLLATTSVTTGTYGNGTEIPQFTVDEYGRITSASTYSIVIPEQFEVGSGLTANDGVLSVNVENGLSIDNNSVVLGGTLSIDTLIDGNDNNLEFTGNEYFHIGSNDFELNFTGSATVSVGSSEEGIVYSATPSSATPLTLIHKDYVDNQINELADVDNLSIILNENNQIQISPTAAGNGLTFSDSTGIIDIIWGGTQSGLTFSVDSLGVNVDGTTIQINNDGELTVVAGALTPVYDLFVGTVSTGDNFPTGLTLSYTPNSYSRIEVYVNGQKQRLGDGSSSSVDCYFDLSGKSLTDLVAGDELYWNGSYAQYDLSASDSIEIVYEK
jgi:hypothetical protein